LRALFFALLIPLLQAPPRDAVPARERTAPAGNASVSGRVYSAATGTPLRGALVFLAPSSTVFDPLSLRMTVDAAKSGVSTDATGQFQITSVVPGVYYVVVMPSSYGGRYLAGGYGAVRGNDPGKPITIAGGADVRGVDIALPLSLAIEGRVVDDAGEPLSRMPVFAARLTPGSDTAVRVTSVSAHSLLCAFASPTDWASAVIFFHGLCPDGANPMCSGGIWMGFRGTYISGEPEEPIGLAVDLKAGFGFGFGFEVKNVEPGMTNDRESAALPVGRQASDRLVAELLLEGLASEDKQTVAPGGHKHHWCLTSYAKCCSNEGVSRI